MHDHILTDPRFGIEFAPEVVQADGNVKNLAWRICNAKKILVSATVLLRTRAVQLVDIVSARPRTVCLQVAAGTRPPYISAALAAACTPLCSSVKEID
jgi:hypothetical protein